MTTIPAAVIAALLGGGEPEALLNLSGAPVPATPSAVTQSDIPVHDLVLYQQAAATCPGEDWTVLARGENLPANC